MNKEIPILIIGVGSIGKRHFENLVTLGYHNISVVSRFKTIIDGLEHIKVFPSIQDAYFSKNYKVAFVCNPTAYHANTVLELLQFNIQKIYLEKPVSHSANQLQELVAAASVAKAIITVGYDLRYDPGLEKIKELVTDKTLGNLLSVTAQVGQYLPDWRPTEDYSIGMSAKKETGGGVLLDLVHEFDYLFWLCGKAKKVACFYQNTATLNIETEDIANVMMQFENNITATIHLDYLQPQLVRNCMLTCTKGSIYWDLPTCTVSWISTQKEKHSFTYQNFERNNRFIAIVKDFMEDHQTNKTVQLSDGIESLKMVLAAKYASEHDTIVHLNQFVV